MLLKVEQKAIGHISEPTPYNAGVSRSPNRFRHQYTGKLIGVVAQAPILRKVFRVKSAIPTVVIPSTRTDNQTMRFRHQTARHNVRTPNRITRTPAALRSTTEPANRAAAPASRPTVIRVGNVPKAKASIRVAPLSAEPAETALTSML